MSAPIVPIISPVAIITSVTSVAAIALKTFVARIAVVAPPAVPVGRIEPGAIVVPVMLLLRSTVPTRLVLEPLGVAGIYNVIQRTNHVIHALSRTRTCTGRHRQQSD
jgi:hypothetical protein